jgi:16S rRNA (guanine527-N7)-methyltransferase
VDAAESSETRAILAQAGYEPSPEEWEFFERLRARIAEANAQLNLTRLVGVRDFWLKHVLDSLLPFFAVPGLMGLDDKSLVADFGSGGGFPGFALAHRFPHWDVALIERTQKKCDFLEETVEKLGLTNVFVVPLDAREAIHKVEALDRGCDLVVARAVGRLAKVTTQAEPLLRPHGLLLHYKGGTLADDEIAEGAAAAKKMGAVQHAPVFYELPPDQRRAAVIVESKPQSKKRQGVRKRKQMRKREDQSTQQSDT